MKKGVLLFTIIIFSAFISSDDKDCSQFKNGKFLFHLRGRQADIYFSIERKDSIQWETDPKSGLYSKLAIKWTSPCEYEARLLETTFVFPDSIQKIRKTIPLKTEITSWTKDYYIFRSHRANTTYVMTDTMWVQKK